MNYETFKKRFMECMKERGYAVVWFKTGGCCYTSRYTLLRRNRLILTVLKTDNEIFSTVENIAYVEVGRYLLDVEEIDGN